MNEELFDIRPPIVEDLQPAGIHGYEEQDWGIDKSLLA